MAYDGIINSAALRKLFYSAVPLLNCTWSPIKHASMHKNWVLALGAPPQRQTCDLILCERQVGIAGLRTFFLLHFQQGCSSFFCYGMVHRRNHNMLIAEIEVPPFLPILLHSELIFVHQGLKGFGLHTSSVWNDEWVSAAHLASWTSFSSVITRSYKRQSVFGLLTGKYLLGMSQSFQQCLRGWNGSSLGVYHSTKAFRCALGCLCGNGSCI